MAINKRIFGTPLTGIVRDKLEARQGNTQNLEPGEYLKFAEQINLISKWIKNGSSFEKSIKDFKQNGFSGNFQFGFIRDFPLNNDSTRVGVRLALTVFDPFSTKRTTVSGTGKYTQSDANFGSILGGCDYKGSTSITGMKFYFNSGNLTAHFRAYGIVNS